MIAKKIDDQFRFTFNILITFGRAILLVKIQELPRIHSLDILVDKSVDQGNRDLFVGQAEILFGLSIGWVQAEDISRPGDAFLIISSLIGLLSSLEPIPDLLLFVRFLNFLFCLVQKIQSRCVPRLQIQDLFRLLDTDLIIPPLISVLGAPEPIINLLFFF